MKNNLIILLGLLWLAGCSDDTVPTVDPNKGNKVEEVILSSSTNIRMAMRGDHECIAWLPESRISTRAAKSSSKDLPASMPASIAVWGYNNGQGLLANGYGEIFRNQEMFYIYGSKYPKVKDNLGLGNWESDNDWPYAPQRPWVNGLKYRFFANSPYTQMTGMLNDSVEVPAPSYDGFKRFIWRHLPKYSTTDYMITDRIVQYQAHEYPNQQQKLMMMHLYSRLRFCFKLGSKYGDRRKIVIKKAELIDLHGLTVMVLVEFNQTEEEILDDKGDVLYAVGDFVPTLTHSIELNTATYDFQTLENEPDENHRPIKSITISDEYNKLAANDSDMPEYQPLASVYVYPYDNLESFNVRITYDVYDIEGQLLRKDDTATNTIPIHLLNASAERDGDVTKRYLEAGYYYNVNITVEPEYLYVLSDNDFDADGFIVVKPD